MQSTLPELLSLEHFLAPSPAGSGGGGGALLHPRSQPPRGIQLPAGINTSARVQLTPSNWSRGPRPRPRHAWSTSSLSPGLRPSFLPSNGAPREVPPAEIGAPGNLPNYAAAPGPSVLETTLLSISWPLHCPAERAEDPLSSTGHMTHGGALWVPPRRGARWLLHWLLAGGRLFIHLPQGVKDHRSHRDSRVHMGPR